MLLTHPSAPVELASGIDALYLSARGTVPQMLLDELEQHRTTAHDTETPVDTTLGGYLVRVLGSGWGKYRYCAQHELARIGITHSERLPAVRIQPTALALHSLGPAQTVLFVRNLLDAAGVVDATLSVSRLDLHSDWQHLPIDADERTSFVTYSDRRALYEVDDQLTGLNFGKRGGAVYARVYDKTRESTDHGHDYWPKLWGPAFDPNLPVIRIEFEFTRDGLREFGVNTPEEAFDMTGALWAYATHQWLTLRIPSGDETRSRWPLDPRWAAVQRSSLVGASIPAERIRAGEHAGTLRKMLPALVGYLTGAALPLGTHDIDDTLDALVPHLVAHSQQTGVSFADRISDKRRRS
ncbi:MAG: hypothetical protein R8G01_03910 [Ilumatobacteraceae bacterium]|nr:hypothetical protein [Ilumatobacteraceae bacterium]